ncbi:GNAT family N-acetyltransferase [uncultured Cohaesibacter sp.]|uniref:GNAT family N-acetyltransferase n=1 Tax=uncultured Cohaesibacter sp. TaxID=1002546 RepID=UPI00292D0733|nr:GNAT family N-acetyltransferase [uncultured Cohaesibacter sp.]
MLEIDESLQQTEPDSREGSESKPFLLRRPTHRDLPVLVSLATTPVLAKNLCSNWLPTSPASAKAWYEQSIEASNPSDFPFIITDMSGKMVGAICLMLESRAREVEVSVMIKQDHWHHGYATRAIQAVADFAFSNPTMNRPTLDALVARCRVSCGASRRVVEKCGFQYSGTGMAHSQHYNGMIPIDRYSLDRGVWKAIRSWSGMGQSDFWPHPPARTPRNFDLRGAA